MRNNIKNLIGKTINNFKILSLTGDKDKHGHLIVSCVCPYCKTIFETAGYNITTKRVKSCGCYKKLTSVKNINKCNNSKIKEHNYYEIKGNYVFMKMHNTNDITVFDLENLYKFKKYLWHIHKGYVFTTIGNDRISMANMVIGKPQNGLVIDHIKSFNNIPKELNNTKENLRIVTQQQNLMNRAKQKRKCTSQYVGVSYKSKRNKWEAAIGINGKNKFLGQFNTEEEAHQARLKAEQKYFGEYAPQEV